MKTFILHREISRIEHKQVEAETWEDASNLLDQFMNEPIREDDYIKFNGTIEFTGETDLTNE